MTMSFNGRLLAQLGWTWRDDHGTTAIVDSNRFRFTADVADENQPYVANAIWHAEDQQLADGQWLDLELDLLEQDCFGSPVVVSLVAVKVLLVWNKSADAELVVGAAPVDPWPGPLGAATQSIRVAPASPLLVANLDQGWPVAAGANTLRLAAAGGQATFDIALVGTTGSSSSSSSQSSSDSSSS